MSMTNTQTNTQAEIVRIKKDALVAGDVIATRSHTMSSTGVRVATGARVSHAILYTGAKQGLQQAVDAMPEKGVTKDILRNKLKQVSYVVVFRHRTATTEQCARACAWAEVQALVHKPYDYRSAARVGIVPYTNVGQLIIIADEIDAKLSPEGEDASFMCSELVFRAFEIAGAPLTNKPAYCMGPGMLFKTDRLSCIGRLA